MLEIQRRTIFKNIYNRFENVVKTRSRVSFVQFFTTLY